MKFRNEYAFLSNFYTCTIPLSINGRTFIFRNAEAAFQAMKQPSRAEEFTELTGGQAKRLGRQVRLRSDWESCKNDIMLTILRQKFRPDSNLAYRLKGVEGEIVEDNTWGDTYWGRCNGKGENHLGKCLMQIRAELLAAEHGETL